MTVSSQNLTVNPVTAKINLFTVPAYLPSNCKRERSHRGPVADRLGAEGPAELQAAPGPARQRPRLHVRATVPSPVTIFH